MPARGNEKECDWKPYVCPSPARACRNTISDICQGIAVELVRKHPSTRKFEQLESAREEAMQSRATIRKLEREVRQLKPAAERVEKTKGEVVKLKGQLAAARARIKELESEVRALKKRLGE